MNSFFLPSIFVPIISLFFPILVFSFIFFYIEN